MNAPAAGLNMGFEQKKTYLPETEPRFILWSITQMPKLYTLMHKEL
jgi:hypothetical protein